MAKTLSLQIASGGAAAVHGNMAGPRSLRRPQQHTCSGWIHDAHAAGPLPRGSPGAAELLLLPRQLLVLLRALPPPRLPPSPPSPSPPPGARPTSSGNCAWLPGCLALTG